MTAPSVSVIIPMLNEAGFVGPCIDGFLAQTTDAIVEILVIDGGSTDGSDLEVLRRRSLDRRVRLVRNPRRLAAAAANIGIDESVGEVLCFVSAHGVPDPGYVGTALAVLDETGAVGVGGRYDHVGTDPVSNAIGLAMASPFGMASPHRTSQQRRDVDTISHPVFRKSALVEIGGYDETLLRNEDYETNYRLRRAGGRLVFTPELSSVYRPRRSLGALGRQFWDYGYWKAEVMARHPDAVRPRHLAPPAAVAGAIVLAAGLTPPATRAAAQRGAAAIGVAYGALLGAAVIRERPAAHGASTRHFVAALPLIHGAWGGGVLAGAVGALRRRRRAADADVAAQPAGSPDPIARVRLTSGAVG